MLRHAFADDFVIHGAQLLPDARLNLAPKANLALALRDLPSHGVPGFRLVFLRSRRLDVNCLTGLHFSSCPRYRRLPDLPLPFPSIAGHQRLSLALVPAKGRVLEPWLRSDVVARSLGNLEGEGLLSTSQAVLQLLPFLRRYARALTGSQASGDAYVAATLESLIASPQIIDSGPNRRVALYRLFTKIWNSVAVNGKADAVVPNLSPEQHLTQITPLPRQAFLLVALEGFSEEDAAQILDCDLPTLRGLVEESGRELAAEIATDVLIIEDETFIAMDIEALVESLGHRVIGVARTHTEAIALARQKRPGLILADIQLADGSSGLDAVNELLDTFEVPVIFITAYPERFLTGQRPEPAFLIAKPFQLAVVSAVASQALFFGRKARQRERQPTA